MAGRGDLWLSEKRLREERERTVSLRARVEKLEALFAGIAEEAGMPDGTSPEDVAEEARSAIWTLKEMSS